jgi:hypothetical protein
LNFFDHIASVIKDRKETFNDIFSVVETQVLVLLFKNLTQDERIVEVWFSDWLVPDVSFQHVYSVLRLIWVALVKLLPELISFCLKLVLLGGNPAE